MGRRELPRGVAVMTHMGCAAVTLLCALPNPPFGWALSPLPPQGLCHLGSGVEDTSLSPFLSLKTLLG